MGLLSPSFFLQGCGTGFASEPGRWARRKFMGFHLTVKDTKGQVDKAC